MVGLRVFDVGLLIAWLVWFFRLRDTDEDDPPDDGGSGGGPEPDDDAGPSGPGQRVPPAKRRPRAHGGTRSRQAPSRRGGRPVPAPLPARVRLPRSPEPVRRV